MHRFYFNLLLALVFCSCSIRNEQTSNQRKLEGIHKYENYSEINLKDLQSYAINSVIYEDGLLYTLDENLLQIFVYSVKKDVFDLLKIITVDDRVSDKILGTELGFNIIGDQILLINRSTVYNLNLNGNLISSYNLYNNGFKGTIGALPIVGTNNPLIKYKNKLYSTVYPDIDAFDSEGRKYAYSLISFRENKSVDTYLEFPSVYEKDYGYNFYNIYGDYIESDNQFIISYPASDSILFYDINNGERIRIKAKSPYLKEIKPWGNAINSYQEYTKFFVLSPSYSYVKYDKYNDIIYRFAERGRNEYEFEAGKLWKEKHILCFTKKLELFDTIQLTDQHLPDMTFVTEQGLMIAKFKDEQTILFDLFVLDSYKNQNLIEN